MDCLFISPPHPRQNSYVETLLPRYDGGWEVGPWGDLYRGNEVMRMEPSWVGLVPLSESQELAVALCSTP